MRLTAAAVTLGLALAGAVGIPVARAHPSEPGVVSYAVLGKGSVGNIVGGPMGWESVFTQPFQGYFVDVAVCNNWADIGLPEVYDDPDLAVVQRGYHPDVGHRPNPPGQAGRRGIRRPTTQRPARSTGWWTGP